MDTPPAYRAVIRDGAILLCDWYPHLARCGPLQQSLRAIDASVCLADLTLLDEPPDRELLVSFVAGDFGAASRDALLSWARSTGHVRVWFPDAVVDLRDEPAPYGEASTECPACGSQWCESGASFWQGVRTSGRFPGLCPTCGAQMPQWELASTTTQLELYPCAG